MKQPPAINSRTFSEGESHREIRVGITDADETGQRLVEIEIAAFNGPMRMGSMWVHLGPRELADLVRTLGAHLGERP